MSESSPQVATPPSLNWIQRLVIWSVLTVVRSIYKVKVVNPERVPASGGVLILPNHVSYVDALIIGVASPRFVRFVIWDELYHIKFLTGFLRLVGTVPISATRAKDGVRSVATALKEGGMVALFPEGQITRLGTVNELKKGFEIMARQGSARVVPMYLDGLFGSVTSFHGGFFFKKRPKRLRCPVHVYFGEPMDAKAATAVAVREALVNLSAEAFLLRPIWQSVGEDRVAFANALRLCDVNWHVVGDQFLCLEPAGSPIYRTVHELARLLPGTKIVADHVEAGGAPLVVFCGSETLSGLTGAERLAFCWQGVNDPLVPLSDHVYRGCMDASTGILVSTELPDPPAAGGEDPQNGRKAGALGRMLPCMRPDSVPADLRVDEAGFVESARPD